VLTVGVDLAAEPKGTAVAWVKWGAGRAVVLRVSSGADDETILRALAEADMAGIDCPLGWPDAFVGFIADHHRGAVTIPGNFPEHGWKRPLTMRLTDLVVRQETGLTPLSVSADLIGHVAMRWACVAAESALQGRVIDRSGAGPLTEVYPAASLKGWGLPHGGYKQRENRAALGGLVDGLALAAPWLALGDAESACRTSHDAFDAVVAALTARAAARNLTLRPSTPEEEAAARSEGWIAIPRKETTLGQLRA
jgi:predicted nuclease with RNAse H fold